MLFNRLICCAFAPIEIHIPEYRSCYSGDGRDDDSVFYSLCKCCSAYGVPLGFCFWWSCSYTVEVKVTLVILFGT